MSKNIDKSDLSALDEEDLNYLHDHGEITLGQYAEAIGMDEYALAEALAAVHTPVPLSEQANTGDANTRGLTIEDHDAMVKTMAREQGVDAQVEDYDYEDMNNDERRALLASRGLPVDGNKAELIERLEQSDIDSGKVAEDDEDNPEE